MSLQEDSLQDQKSHENDTDTAHVDNNDAATYGDERNRPDEGADDDEETVSDCDDAEAMEVEATLAPTTTLVPSTADGGDATLELDTKKNFSENDITGPGQQTIFTLQSPMRRPPKMRLKLSMRKLPTLANRKSLPLTTTATALSADSDGDMDMDDDDMNDVKATIVDSDDGGDDIAVAATVEGGKPLERRKRRTPLPSRTMKLPPIASPGLRMLSPSSAAPKELLKHSAYVTPAAVFDRTMKLAGYSEQQRTEHPHRGSSVRRHVGDMFDSNVALSLRFPSLVPTPLLVQHERSACNGGDATITAAQDLPSALIQSLQRETPCADDLPPFATNNYNVQSSKRNRPWQFANMVPVSLTLPYPHEYIQNCTTYIEEVNVRERAIIALQEAQDVMESSTILANSEQPLESSDGHVNGTPLQPPDVPPIPKPPTPPPLTDLGHPFVDDYDDSNHPICIPRKTNYVSHLDEDCFHITHGRYFGLYSSLIADPNFVGPNAPGISGVNASGGSGLATSSSGGGISGAMALTLSTTYNGTTAGSAAALKSAILPVASMAAPVTKSTPFKKVAAEKTEESPLLIAKSLGPKPSKTYSDLKKVFDNDDPETAKRFKDCIVKAAVHASRAGMHGQSWAAPNGERYPDVSKAFKEYAAIKPCQRCKSNKQGAYHCRLRRKHKELDYDGGNSPAVLAPLFTAPMDSLLLPTNRPN